jgi:hypothetical protein
MTFSTSLVDRELALLRDFNDREVRELTPAQLHNAADVLGKVRRAVDALVVSVAGEVGRRSAPGIGVGGLARREGFSTPQEFLANTLGTSTYDAKRLIDVGSALDAGQSDTDLVEGAEIQEGAANSSAGDQCAKPHSPVVAPKYRLLAAAVNSGSLGVEAAALVTRTLESVRPVMESNLASVSSDTVALHETSASKGVVAADFIAEFLKFERRLVEKAQSLSLRELRRVCERERAWISPKDLAEKERRHREQRTLFFGEDSDGMVLLTARLDAASAAPVKAWIEAQVRHTFQQRRRNSSADGSDVTESQNQARAALSDVERQRLREAHLTDDRTAGQIRVDNLVMLARHGLDCETPTSGVKTTVVLRVDVKDLENDLAQGECDQLSSPISVGTLRTMAVDAGVMPVVMGGDSLPLDVGRLRRYFTVAQRIALAERDGGCSWCHAPPSFCEAHHIDWWAKDQGRSDIHNGVLLCVGCHHRIHRDGWGITLLDNEVWFQPPPIDGRAVPARIGGRAHLSMTSYAKQGCEPLARPNQVDVAGF